MAGPVTSRDYTRELTRHCEEPRSGDEAIPNCARRLLRRAGLDTSRELHAGLLDHQPSSQ